MKLIKKLKPSSRKWVERQLSDSFTKKAKIEGYRSRSAYKLIEINNKYKIFNRVSKIIDLGASPGGWSQVLFKYLPHAKIIAIDKIEMPKVNGVVFIKGDFEEIQNTINEQVDLILSDMAPNSTGFNEIDQARSLNLAELVLCFAKRTLTKHGKLVVKLFHGRESAEFIKEMKKTSLMFIYLSLNLLEKNHQKFIA